ncbi:MAG: hypothetical protein BV457_07230 [Thermoplasmata archaeon M9B1D]|nr:MAG: hypothetical protein BV457_07230 [Thermoplasmata archaeon M9B1D]
MTELTPEEQKQMDEIDKLLGIDEPSENALEDELAINYYESMIDPDEGFMVIYSKNRWLNAKINSVNVCPMFYDHELGTKYLEYVNTMGPFLGFSIRGLKQDVKRDFRWWQYKQILLEYY